MLTMIFKESKNKMDLYFFRIIDLLNNMFYTNSMVPGDFGVTS